MALFYIALQQHVLVRFTDIFLYLFSGIKKFDAHAIRRSRLFEYYGQTRLFEYSVYKSRILISDIRVGHRDKIRRRERHSRRCQRNMSQHFVVAQFYRFCAVEDFYPCKFECFRKRYVLIPHKRNFGEASEKLRTVLRQSARQFSIGRVFYDKSPCGKCVFQHPILIF